MEYKRKLKKLIEKLEKCDNYHSKCDCLLNSDEITYLLGFIAEQQMLCDGYEEEHNNTFTIWVNGLQRILRTIEFLEDYYDNYYAYSFEEDRDKIYTAIQMLKGEDNEQGKDN